MTFADELHSSLSTIYEAITDYPHSSVYKQDLEEVLSSLEFLLLKVQNPDKEVDGQVYNKIQDLVEKRIDIALNGIDPFMYKPDFVLKEKKNIVQLLSKESSSEQIKKFALKTIKNHQRSNLE